MCGCQMREYNATNGHYYNTWNRNFMGTCKRRCQHYHRSCISYVRSDSEPEKDMSLQTHRLWFQASWRLIDDDSKPFGPDIKRWKLWSIPFQSFYLSPVTLFYNICSSAGGVSAAIRLFLVFWKFDFHKLRPKPSLYIFAICSPPQSTLNTFAIVCCYTLNVVRSTFYIRNFLKRLLKLRAYGVWIWSLSLRRFSSFLMKRKSKQPKSIHSNDSYNENSSANQPWDRMSLASDWFFSSSCANVVVC